MTSLIGYLQWGGGNHAYLFQSEFEIITKLFKDPTSVIHPFIVLPLISQLLLLITLFQKKPNKYLTYLSIAGLGLLLGFMCIIGFISLNAKVILSTLPFIILSVYAVFYYKNLK